VGVVFFCQYSGFSGIGGDAGVAKRSNLYAATCGDGSVYKHRHGANAAAWKEVE